MFLVHCLQYVVSMHLLPQTWPQTHIYIVRLEGVSRFVGIGLCEQPIKYLPHMIIFSSALIISHFLLKSQQIFQD